MSFIEPLNLQTWLINVFAGDSTYFSAIALFVIVGLSAYFRMNMLAMFFMIGIFLLMFSGFINSPIVILIAIIGGLLVGYWVSRIVK